MVMVRLGKLSFKRSLAGAARAAASPVSAAMVARRVSMAPFYRRRCRMPLVTQHSCLEGAHDRLLALAGFRRVADGGDDLARFRKRDEVARRRLSRPVVKPVA